MPYLRPNFLEYNHVIGLTPLSEPGITAVLAGYHPGAICVSQLATRATGGVGECAREFGLSVIVLAGMMPYPNPRLHLEHF